MLANTTDELATLFRQDVDDVLGSDGDDSDRLWSDVEVYRYMTQACDALAKITDGLYRVFELPVVEGEAVVGLPRHVLHIREARLQTRNTPVRQRNANDQSVLSSDDYGLVSRLSMFEATGTPTEFIRDYERKNIRFNRIPVEDDTLELQCTVTLAMPLAEGMVVPFLDIEDQTLLLVHMAGSAYSKRDAETYRPDLARDKKDEFAAGAADRAAKLASYRREPGVVRMEDYGWRSNDG